MPDCPGRSHHAATGDGSQIILVFDGACNLCNGFVRFILKRDRAGRFAFSASQSAFGSAAMAANGLDPADPSSMLLITKGETLQKSTAAIVALASLGGPWRLMRLFLWVPRLVRDWAYGWVARNRYRWLKAAAVCEADRHPGDQRFLN